MQKPEIYVSTDIEADGFIVGKNSILSIGSAAFLADKTLIDTFSINLDILPEGESSPETMLWWQDFPDAWATCRKNCQAPQIAMQQYATWLKQLPGKPIFVASPSGFDFSFIYYYFSRFAQDNPFGYAVIDMRSYFMGMQHSNYGQSGKKNWPKEWAEDYPHTHIALDDALEQGMIFCNMLAANKNIP